MQANIKHYIEHSIYETTEEFEQKERDAFYQAQRAEAAKFERNLRFSVVQFKQKQEARRADIERFIANKEAVISAGERWEKCTSNAKLEVSTFGRIRYTKTCREVPLNFNSDGVLMVSGAIGRGKLLHRLVADQFIPNNNPKKYRNVRFVNGDKRLTAVFNLERTDNAGNVQAFDQYLERSYTNTGARYTEYEAEKWRGYKGTAATIKKLIKYGLEPGEEHLLDGMEELEKRNKKLDELEAKKKQK